MHDMWPITGGCHHSFTCEKYRSACSRCQVFSEKKRLDLAAAGFRKKQKLYARYDNLYFVSPSKWLYECARRSALTKSKPVFHIPNVLDRKKFKPIDKKVAKKILNIPAGEQVIAFGAVSIDSPYKGWEYLKTALQLLPQLETSREISVLVFGGADQQVLSGSIPFKTRFLGRIQDEYAMSVVYNAANVVVAPSTADNLPYVVFESLACGTPVVAFEVGGIPDLIRHKNNGYLAQYKDANDLAVGMAYCLDQEMEVKTPPEFDTATIVQMHRKLCETITTE
jgi:glycosyltransferase involved in cell wall biosynthesis